MKRDDLVQSAQFSDRERRKHAELIRELLNLRVDYDWSEIEQAVREAKYQSEFWALVAVAWWFN